MVVSVVCCQPGEESCSRTAGLVLGPHWGWARCRLYCSAGGGSHCDRDSDLLLREFEEKTWKIPHLHSSPSICWAKWSSPSYQWDTFTPLKALTLKKLYLQSKNNIMQDLHKCLMSCSVKVYLASRSNHLCPANLIKSCVPATFKGKEGQWRRWQKVCVRRRVHIDHTWQTHFHRIQCSSCHFLHYSEVSIIINCMIIYSLNTSCMRYVAEILT